jgi:hypothetical protein
MRFSISDLIAVIASETEIDPLEIEPDSLFYGGLYCNGLEVDGIFDRAEVYFNISIPYEDWNSPNPYRGLIEIPDPNRSSSVRQLWELIMRLQDEQLVPT